MSRVGKVPITIPSGVTVAVEDAQVKVSGPKGELVVPISSRSAVNQEASAVVVTRDNEEEIVRAAHGLNRAMIANAITGVNEGFKKQLEVNGVGYKVQASGKNLKLSLGLSHDINFTIPDDIEVKIEKNLVTVEGIDKQRVGMVAADIRELRKPEPYKGKGIKYIDEHIVRKAGKTAGSGE